MHPNKKRSGDVIANNTRETTLENRFPNLSPVSLPGEIVQPSSASYTPVVYLKHLIDSSRWSRHNPCARRTLPGKLSPYDLWETYEVSHVCRSVVLRLSTGAYQCVDTVCYSENRQQDDCISREHNTSYQDFQCKAEGVCWHTKRPSTLLKKRLHENISRPRAYLGHDLTLIYRRLVYRKYGNQSTNIGLTSD